LLVFEPKSVVAVHIDAEDNVVHNRTLLDLDDFLGTSFASYEVTISHVLLSIVYVEVQRVATAAAAAEVDSIFVPHDVG
jgi:hypothetical protein